MKKILALILATIMMLFLAACGGGNETPEDTAMTKEEMLAVAEDLVINDLANDIATNELRAVDTYVGKFFTITGYISEVTTEYCIIDEGSYITKCSMLK